MFRKMTCGIPMNDNVDYRMIVKGCPGYVAADLKALIREAAVYSV